MFGAFLDPTVQKDLKNRGAAAPSNPHLTRQTQNGHAALQAQAPYTQSRGWMQVHFPIWKPTEGPAQSTGK